MKKAILFLSIIGAVLLMTSCLGETTNNYTDQGFVYLDMDGRGTPYGKAVNPQVRTVRWITHSSMMTMQPGTIKYMVFSWEEEKGTTPITIGGQTAEVDNVDLISDPLDITTTNLRISERPEVDEPIGFEEIAAPIYHEAREFMNDYWIIQYTYMAKKGESAQVEFYKRDELNERGEIVIDIHLTLNGTPEGDSSVRTGDAIAVNMSQLRMGAGGSAAEDELKIRFNYYKQSSGSSEPEETESQNVYTWRMSGDE